MSALTFCVIVLCTLLNLIIVIAIYLDVHANNNETEESGNV